jgi:integrase
MAKILQYAELRLDEPRAIEWRNIDFEVRGIHIR